MLPFRGTSTNFYNRLLYPFRHVHFWIVPLQRTSLFKITMWVSRVQNVSFFLITVYNELNEEKWILLNNFTRRISNYGLSEIL